MSSVLDFVWVIGVAASLGFLAYGALLCVVFHYSASEVLKRAVARLAMHEAAGALWRY